MPMQLTVQLIDDLPRVNDLVLAEKLEFAEPRAIRKLIEREKNLERLSRRGRLYSEPRDTASRGGPAGNVYWLTKWQAIKICMWSEAPNADAVQDEIADVFDAYTDGKLVPAGQAPATNDMFGQLFRTVKDVANNVLRLVSSNERIENHCARAADRMNDVIPRYEPSPKSQRIYLHVVKTNGGLCPCGCRQKLLDEKGSILLRDNGNPVLEYDHMYSRERNGLAAMWPLHHTCNAKVKDEDYRNSKLHRFLSFQDDVKSLQSEVPDPPRRKVEDDDSPKFPGFD